jgi:hypothetical protein
MLCYLHSLLHSLFFICVFPYGKVICNGRNINVASHERKLKTLHNALLPGRVNEVTVYLQSVNKVS